MVTTACTEEELHYLFVSEAECLKRNADFFSFSRRNKFCRDRGVTGTPAYLSTFLFVKVFTRLDKKTQTIFLWNVLDNGSE